MIWKIITAPLLGGLIGYITNDIAIKMLFRPRKALYIGKWHIPFTPGLIPQQKDRIAESIGNVISVQLLNSDILKTTILSEDMVSRIRIKLEEWADQCRNDTRTLEEILTGTVGEEKVIQGKNAICEKGADFLTDKMEQAHIGEKMVEIFHEKLQQSFLGKGALSFLLKDSIGNIEENIAGIINEMIREKAPDIIRDEIKKSEDEFLQKQLCDICESQEERIPELIDRMVSVYQSAVEKGLDRVLKAVDIQKIVADKVRSFDAVELEQMIFGIMRKELRYIVYLGALLGCIMGCVNLLVF